MIDPTQEELFFFGMAVNKFAPHKAARILGLRRLIVNQDMVSKNCFLLEYGDGEQAFAIIEEESVGVFELMTAEEGVKKYGEDTFK